MSRKRYFFVPYKGKKYETGLLKGKKVMVLGASYYCKPKKDCPFFDDCTRQWKRREYCPENNGRPLHDLPKNEIDEEGAKSYKVFYEFMQNYLSDKIKVTSFDDFWDNIAFTNYIQHIIGGRTTTQTGDMSENDLDALGDVIRELKPDIVIIWGCVVDKPVKQKKCDADDNQFENDYDGEGSSQYLFHWTIDNRKVTFVSFYHPSSGYFLRDQSNMKHYLDVAFKE